MIAGLFLVIIEILRSFPACLRVRRLRNVDGWSGFSLGVLVGNAFGWILLAVLVHSWWSCVANIIWLILGTWLTVMVWRLKASTRKKISQGFALAIGASITALIIGYFSHSIESILGVAVSLMSLGVGIPALIAGMTSETTKGLSLWNLAAGTSEGVIYTLSGLGFGLIAPSGEFIIGFLFYGVLGIIYNVPRLVRTSYRRALKKE